MFEELYINELQKRELNSYKDINHKVTIHEYQLCYHRRRAIGNKPY